ncbi:MAG: phage tail sheath family protein [Flavobacteriales bacterium]|nr:phage tail sheath family protein [Flavobacteriales bacterium]
MSTTMKTPGVYIQELDAFGNAVVPVPTAVPAFIGYTAQTTFNGQNLLNKAVKVTSLAEFLMIYGATAPEVSYKITKNVLPSRLDDLNKQLANSQKVLDKAKKDFESAGGDPSTITAADVTAATTALQAAQTANTTAPTAQTKAAVAANQALLTNLQVAANITAVSADTNIAALLAAQTALTTAETAAAAANPPGVADQDGSLAAAVKAAQTTLNNIAADADFTTGGYAYKIETTTINYRMYSSVKFFYENGGGDCYIMSIGTYDYSKKAITDTTDFMNALTLLEKETEPTMLVIPDLVEIYDSNVTDNTTETYYQDRFKNAYSLQNEMINHCGNMMNRVAILDVPGGFAEPNLLVSTVDQFRNSVEPLDPKFNSYAAVYYPWLHTTVYQTSEISYKNINPNSYQLVNEMLQVEFTDPNGVYNDNMAKIVSAFNTDQTLQQTTLDKADLILSNLSTSYQLLTGAIMKDMNLIAPSAGMAGIYTSVDNNEGVWVAPANVGIQSTVMPSIKIDHAAQEDLNMPIDGKAVCAIRAFTGRGNLVWGARTLDGNSNDWRYVNVRRTLIYIEQSVKDAAKAYVFAPNDAGTWVNVKSMISSFLTGLWNQGGLVGPKPADAFSVSVGLGSTMTGDDILNGIMRVAVKVAVSHPAEFIEITFQQEMQKG